MTAVAEFFSELEKAEGLLQNPRANLLRARAVRIHYRLLGRLSRLADAEADLVEPAFTRFEEQLFNVLPRLPIGRRPSGSDPPPPSSSPANLRN